MKLNGQHSAGKHLPTLKCLCAAATLSSAALLSSNAAANAISGGITQVALDADIAGLIVGTLGVTPEATGSATFEGLTFTFPITGGTLSEQVIPGSTIEHDGSGIRFSAGDASLSIGNFVIDTTALTIFGDAGGTPGVPLFALAADTGNESLPFSVALTDDAAGALNTTFNVQNFAGGLVIGAAATTPDLADVPEPATLSLLAIGLAAIGWHSASRKRATLAC